MLLHPDLLLDLAHLNHQNRLSEVETWRLIREARQSRAKFLGRLLHRLLAAAREQLRIQVRPNSMTSDLANLPK